MFGSDNRRDRHDRDMSSGRQIVPPALSTKALIAKAIAQNTKKLTPRQKKGKKYWDILCIAQRRILLAAHGGFSDKYCDMPYSSLTESLQQICNEAAITPGGIIPLKRLTKIGVLNPSAFSEDSPEYWWSRCPSLNK